MSDSANSAWISQKFIRGCFLLLFLDGWVGKDFCDHEINVWGWKLVLQLKPVFCIGDIDYNDYNDDGGGLIWFIWVSRQVLRTGLSAGCVAASPADTHHRKFPLTQIQKHKYKNTKNKVRFICVLVVQAACSASLTTTNLQATVTWKPSNVSSRLEQTSRPPVRLFRDGKLLL